MIKYLILFFLRFRDTSRVYPNFPVVARLGFYGGRVSASP